MRKIEGMHEGNILSWIITVMCHESLLCWHVISACWKYPANLQSSGHWAHEAAVPAGSGLLCEWVSVQHCHGNPGADWHSGWAPPAQLWTCSLLSARGLPCHSQGTLQGGASPGRDPCTRECLDNPRLQFVEKHGLGYQTVLGMQINWCNCRINSVNSWKIKTLLFSEVLPGSRVHWATITLLPLKISKVEWHCLLSLLQPYETWPWQCTWKMCIDYSECPITFLI